MNKIKILALMGEAGAGKDTVMQALLRQYPELYEIVSCTSRPPRENEVNHINYHFYSREDFEDKIKNNEMLEYTEFNNWYYGTGLDSVKTEGINVGVFNPEGVNKILSDPRLDVIVVRICASDKTRLLRQLNRENNPDVDEIIRRWHTDVKDFSNLEFLYMPVYNNDSTPEAVGEIIYNHLGIWTKVDN